MEDEIEARIEVETEMIQHGAKPREGNAMRAA